MKDSRRCPQATHPDPEKRCWVNACPHYYRHGAITRQLASTRNRRCVDPCPRYPGAGPCVPITAKKMEGAA